MTTRIQHQIYHNISTPTYIQPRLYNLIYPTPYLKHHFAKTFIQQHLCNNIDTHQTCNIAYTTSDIQQHLYVCIQTTTHIHYHLYKTIYTTTYISYHGYKRMHKPTSTQQCTYNNTHTTTHIERHVYTIIYIHRLYNNIYETTSIQ